MTNMNELLKVEPLTADSIRELWGKTYNKEGKPDWSHIFPYYHDEIIFQDSIQRIEGIDDFKELCQRLTDRCEQLSMDIFTIAESPGSFFFDWEMVMTFRKWPSSSIFGTTKLTIGEDNRIIQQRDYFDLWGDIFNNIPYFHKPYRRFMKRYFG
ncbi:MAG: nuclear transport factor 2 family protein [Anaerolineales bacterium]